MNAGLRRLLQLGYRVARPGFFALDPERSHEWAFIGLRSLEFALRRLRPSFSPIRDPRFEQTVAGLVFPNPVGLAAGLDKNAELPHVWALLGFGFAELGTVTAHPQPGNPKPRLWRFPEVRAVVNRMGFNNWGAARVARNLAQTLASMKSPIPLGINIGKSVATPLAQAADDYATTFTLLAPLADYLCVNVSSPNTPGLRELQSPEQLSQILHRLHQENQRLVAAGKLSHARPVFVKVAPDLSAEQIAALAAVVRSQDVAAVVATNTTTARDTQETAFLPPGGLSGAPLRERATAVIRQFFRCLEGRVPIVGVGGVFSAEDAYEKIQAGASLVQIYTALVYEGPGIAPAICHGLLRLLERDGANHLSEVVGRRAD